jgi:hypothetical protein
MAYNFNGITEGGFNFISRKPFVLLGWPARTDAMTFDTEVEARQFIARTQVSEPFVAFAKLYGFSGKKWNAL